MSMLITGPSLGDPGGVASFYNSVLPYMRKHAGAIDYLEIGNTHRRGGALYPIVDQLRLRRAVLGRQSTVALINPTLDWKSFIRDGIFIRQAKSAGHKVIVFFRGWFESFAAEVEARWQWFFRDTYLHADMFIVLASGFGETLRRWGVRAPVELATTTVASELVSEFSLHAKHKTLRNESDVSVLFLARLIKEKGVMETLEAASMLRKQGTPISLTVAGDGAAMPDVRRFVAKHDPERSFLRTAGDVRAARKRSLFETHDVYCFPSYAEGMPNSVLEAMAFGMPVVTCSTGGLRDFFVDGRMGYFVAPRSSADVADALSRLIASRTAREQMGTYNHQYALERFLAPRVAEHLLSLYRRVVES